MDLPVKRVDGGYVKGSADSTALPVSRREMAQQLEREGTHSRDVVEYLRFADRAWLVDHPDEPDPGEYFSVSRSERGYMAMTDRRTGFKVATLATPAEVVQMLTAEGFGEDAVRAQLDEIDQHWEHDQQLQAAGFAFEIRRRMGGYSMRSVGSPMWLPPMARESMESMLRSWSMDQRRLDTLFTMADTEPEIEV